MKVAVLGGLGLMGEAAVHDLCRQPAISEIIVADRTLARKAAVLSRLPNRRKVRFLALDIRDTPEAARRLRSTRAVINAAWYELNLEAMDLALAIGAHYVDLGGLFHMTRRQLLRHDQFRRKAILAVLGCGSTPGITNVMAAFLAQKMDRIQSLMILDASHDPDLSGEGFLPPFSIRTMMDETEMPAPVLQAGRLRMVPAGSLEEPVQFPNPIGQVSAAAMIHSELATLPGHLKAKGIREMAFKIGYPNVVKSQLAMLLAMGFASKEPIQVRGATMAPIDFLTALAQKGAQSVPARPRDFEVLRLEALGKTGGRRVRIVLDAELKPSGPISAGAAGVGFSAAIAASMALLGGTTRPGGVYAPESCLDAAKFFEEWSRRKVLRLKERRISL